MDVRFELLFNEQDRAHKFPSSQLTAQSSLLTTGIDGQNLDLTVAKDGFRKFTEPMILDTKKRTLGFPPLLEQFFFDPDRSSFCAAAIHSQPEISQIGMIRSNGPQLRRRSLILNYRTSTRIGFGTSGGGMAFSVSVQGKDYINSRTPPKLGMIMKPNVGISPIKSTLDISELDTLDIASKVDWQLRGRRAHRSQTPPPPIRDDPNPKTGQQSSRSSTAEGDDVVVSKIEQKM